MSLYFSTDLENLNNFTNGISFSSVETNEITPTQKNALKNIGEYGELMTTNIQMIISSSFIYSLQLVHNSISYSAGSSITSTNSMANISCGTDTADFAELQSKSILKSNPDQGCVVRVSCIFSQGQTNNIQICGIGDDTDGAFFGYNGQDFGILYRSFGTDTWILKGDWSELATNSFIPLLDPIFGNQYMISYQWGFGPIKFYVYSTLTNSFSLVHLIQNVNTTITPNFKNPNLPILAKSQNTGTIASNSTICLHSFSGFIEGNSGIDLPIQRSEHVLDVTADQNLKTMIILKNMATFNGMPNRSIVSLITLSAHADSQDSLVEVHLNPTLQTAPTFVDVFTGISCVQKSEENILVLSSGSNYTVFVNKSDSVTLTASELDFYIRPGDTLAVCAASVNVNSSQIHVGATWRERQ